MYRPTTPMTDHDYYEPVKQAVREHSIAAEGVPWTAETKRKAIQARQLALVESRLEAPAVLGRGSRHSTTRRTCSA